MSGGLSGAHERTVGVTRFAGRLGGAGFLLAAVLALAACTSSGPAPVAEADRAAAASSRPVEAAASGRSVEAPTPASQASQPLSPPVAVKVGSIGLAGEAGFFTALERGYFRDEGLELELVPFRGTVDQMAPLATGELHFGAGAPDPSIFNAALRDIAIKIVAYNAIIGQDDISAAFIVRKDLIESGRYQGPADFKGLTVVLPPGGGLASLYLERVLNKAGVAVADVPTTNIAFTDMVPALSNKAADAAFAVEPFISVAEQREVAQMVIPIGEIYPGFPAMVLMLSPQFANDQPEAARRFLVAHLRGQRDFYAAVSGQRGSKEDIYEILAKYTPVKDPRLLARMIGSAVDVNGELDPEQLEEVQAYFLRLGTQNQRVDLGRVLDRTYVDYALQRLGRMN
jgi:NitT/TauT family transport system substrate-binding protein